MKALIKIQVLLGLSVSTCSAALASPTGAWVCYDGSQEAMTVEFTDAQTIGFAGPGALGTGTLDSRTQPGALRLNYDNLLGFDGGPNQSLSDIRVTLSSDQNSVVEIETADVKGVINGTYATGCTPNNN